LGGALLSFVSVNYAATEKLAMLESKKRRQNYWTKRQILSEAGKDATASEVLDHLLGDADGGPGSDYVVYKYDSCSRTLINRVNMVWVWPLAALVAPFQWLATGNIGYTRNSRMGRILDWLVKFE
jgi:hypothetical protein